MGVDDFIETNWGRGYMVIDHRADAPAEPALRGAPTMAEMQRVVA
jgi:two-component system cell cycle response regulator CtrA